MASSTDIEGLVDRFRDVDALLATLGDRAVTYSTQTATRTEPASAARERISASITAIEQMSPSSVPASQVAELHTWIDRLEREIRQSVAPPSYMKTAIVIAGVIALGAAAFLA